MHNGHHGMSFEGVDFEHLVNEWKACTGGDQADDDLRLLWFAVFGEPRALPLHPVSYGGDPCCCRCTLHWQAGCLGQC